MEIINTKISGLRGRGFNDTNRMIEKFPAILGLGFENIDTKISGLKDRGFSNPGKMIEKSPSVLYFGFENIDDKLSGLKDRGFSDPHKMIERFPEILSFGFENIDKKIRLLDLLNRTYQLKLNPVSVIEQNPIILGSKFEKLIVIARVLREYQPSVEDIKRKINMLYKINIESLLLAHSEKKPNDTIDNLTNKAKLIQKEKVPKNEKKTN